MSTNENEAEVKSSPAGFDINSKSVAVKEDQGFAVHINDEDGKPLFHGENLDKPVTITVAGTYSSKYRQIEAMIRKRPLKLRRLNGQVFYDDNIEKVIGCTLAWEGFHVNGEPVPLNRQNLHTIYTRFPWVLDQVQEAMDDHSNFSKSASPTP